MTSLSFVQLMPTSSLTCGVRALGPRTHVPQKRFRVPSLSDTLMQKGSTYCWVRMSDTCAFSTLTS